jgi:hypothetical protein
VPISEAVVLRVGNAELVADLNDKQLEAAFTLAEMVALVGLARRKLFLKRLLESRQLPTRRSRIRRTGQGNVAELRRRVGVNNVFVTATVHRVPCPRHASRTSSSMRRCWRSRNSASAALVLGPYVALMVLVPEELAVVADQRLRELLVVR